MIQVLNNYYKNNKNEGSSNINITTTSDTSYSVISEEKISEKTSQKQTQIIDNFMSYCNSGNIENAYNLLSENCKEELYPTIENFKSNYCDRIFTENKLYNVQAWIVGKQGDTYKINLTEDTLATGKVAVSSIEDYYTVIYSNGEYKLNISSYIGKEEINKEKVQNNITIKVISKQIYMEYEIYSIKILNNTGNDIKIDSKEKTTSTYLTDNNDLHYISYNHELLDEDFVVRNGTYSDINMKFNKSYKTNITAKQMVFSDMILNYNEYKSSETKDKYSNRLNFSIDI